MKRDEQMMNAAEAYAEEIGYKDDNDMCCTMNIFCAGWYAADRCSRWIPVEERLPKADGRYIIANKYGGVEQMNFDAESKYWWLRGTGKMSDFVTHWMPLPQPPQGKED